MTSTANPSSTLWRPYSDEPLFVSEMTLGLAALAAPDADRLTRYLAALVAHRGVVHTTVAFNAVYFGYDLAFGGYVGGPIEFDSFPAVTFGEITDALPVGAMLTVETGADPLYAEVVYKEGAHPALRTGGDVPPWLSGAPAGARGPGVAPDPGEHPVLNERLVVDFDAFGPDLVATTTRLDRLRHRGQWLDADGHLVLAARYPSAQDAEIADTEFYARYLLTRGREQLISGPLPLLLTDDAGEAELATALRASLRTVAEALAAVPGLRVWREYAFPREALAARLADTGPLGGGDLRTLAIGLGRSGRPARRHRYGVATRIVRYTSVGPLLRTIDGGARQLRGLGYPAAVCHANVVIGDYARRETTDGVLPGQVHLRLDDPWQGGGVWRATHPPGAYAAVDPLVPYGLGWLDSLPVASGAGAEAGDEPGDLDDGTDLLSVSDSQLSWRVTLRLSHTLTGIAAVPDRAADELGAAGLVGAGLRLVLTHDGYDLDPTEATQAVTVARAGPRLRLAGVTWPLEFFPGIVLTFTWQRGAVLLRARSRLLEAPVNIDGTVYDHVYDPAVLTRETAPGCLRRGQPSAGPLSLRQRVLRAVRRVGQLDENGVAVLVRDRLPDFVYGTDTQTAGAAALGPVVDEMLADATLTAEGATVVGSGFRWPAQPGDSNVVTVLVWRPRPVAAPRPQSSDQDMRAGQGGDASLGQAAAMNARFVRQYAVAPFLRRLPLGWRASDGQRAKYRALTAKYGHPRELPSGYTLVDAHTRGH